MNKGCCMIGQSGGPTAVINASLLGIIEEAKKQRVFDHIYGLLNGIDGILKEKFVDFNDYDAKTLQLLKTTPAAALGSVRFKLPNNFDDKVYQQIEDTFKKYNVRCFYYIGGNDSMDTCHKLGQYFVNKHYDCKVIGIPKTIDNDIVGIDHTPGYGSASKFIYTSISEMYEDTKVYEKGRVTLVEIMGRDSGWLTASTKLAKFGGHGPDLIYLPEHTFDINNFLEDVSRIYNEKKRVMVALSEGIKDEHQTYILKQRLYNQNDSFGHLQLGGVGMVLGEIVNKKLNLPVRSVELNILQRCATHLLSKTDVDEAYNCGKYGVRFYLKGKTDVMITFKRKNSEKYALQYSTVPLEKVANLVKEVPLTWINERGNDLSDDYLNYVMPLIQGDVKLPKVNGIIKYFEIEKNNF